jgi:hypothetical protein
MGALMKPRNTPARPPAHTHIRMQPRTFSNCNETPLSASMASNTCWGWLGHRG